MRYSKGVRTLRRRGVDWILLGLFLGIVLIGWLTLYSTVYEEGQSFLDFNFNSSIGRQTIWIFLSLAAFIAAMAIDWKFWGSFSFIFYGLSIISLVLLFLIGKEIKGATSWFSFGGFSFQPSEFAKLTTCLALASFISSANIKLTKRNHIAFAFGIFLLPAGLILLQPDAGSAIIYLSFLIMLYIAGFSFGFYAAIIGLAVNFLGTLLFGPKIMLVSIILTIGIVLLSFLRNFKWYIGPAVLGVLAAFVFYREGFFNYVLAASLIGLLLVSVLNWIEQNARTSIIILALAFLAIILSFGTDWAFNNLLKPHQQDRINVWLHPEKCNPRGSLYNILQSKTAIGSGGIAGQGYLAGPMTQLDFVPEQETDFIFSSLGEEQGFLGVMGFLALYSFMLYRIIVIAERGKNNFIRYYAYGVFGLLFTHYFVNIGMTLGIMPVIGIPLAFMSKGGSSILAFSIMIAILIRMDME